MLQFIDRDAENRVSMLNRKLISDIINNQQDLRVAEQRIADKDVQNELMVLRMVPAIIRELKAHKLSVFENYVLRNRFGDLWHLIVDESKRSPAEEMNLILSTLLRAQQTHSNAENSNAINNEVQSDNVKIHGRRQRLNARSRLPIRLAKLRLTDDLTPAQRLLKVAAVLIHESLAKNIKESSSQSAPKRNGSSRNARRHHRVHKKQLHQPHGQDLAMLRNKFTQPEVIMNAMRQKRSLKYADSTENEDVAMNLLQSMIKSNEAKEDKDDEMGSNGDDDYNYDDVDSHKSESKDKQKGKNGKSRDQPTDQKKQTQQLKQEQQTEQANFMKTEDYKDYAFDTTDTDHFDEDEDLLRSFYGQKRRSAYDDYDYGSFSDLMHLAAKHTLRAQREDKYLSRFHFDDYLNDDANDEYSDEDYVI